MKYNRAIPLCLPNNYTWNSLTNETRKMGERRTLLQPVPAAIKMLQMIKGINLFSPTYIMLLFYLESEGPFKGGGGILNAGDVHTLDGV